MMSTLRRGAQRWVQRTPSPIRCAPERVGFRLSDQSKLRHLTTSSEEWKVESSSEAEKYLKEGGFKGIFYSRFLTLRVRWGDLDAYGHVNNTVFFRFFEQARVDYLYDMGTSLGPETAEGGVVAETWCKFRAPLMYPDDVTVATASELEENSDSSWVQRYAMLSHKTGVVVAEGSARMVWFDFQTGQKKAIPADFVEFIQEDHEPSKP